jgi:hypothetical protein
MQYNDHDPVWFGTHGVGAKPPSAVGLLRSLPRSLGGYRLVCWPYRGGVCRRVLTHLRFCPMQIPRLSGPGVYRSKLSGNHWSRRCGPRQAWGAMRCVGKFNNTDRTVSPALREWVVRSTLTSFSHSSLSVVTLMTLLIIIVGLTRTCSLLSWLPTHAGGHQDPAVKNGAQVVE